MKNSLVVLVILLLASCQTMGRGANLPTPTEGASALHLTVQVDPAFDVKSGDKSYPLGFGSGLEFVGVDKGELVFWGITDRGPNLDGPSVGTLTSKIFPAPAFAPSVVEVRVAGEVARVTKVIPLKSEGRALTGLPLSPAKVGFSKEVALSFDLKNLGNDDQGLDTEAIRLDAKNPRFAWISDEYGPFIVKVDLTTGEIIQKFGPGTGLPEVLAKRQVNRGMEGLALTPSGVVVGALQSILDHDGKVKSSKAGFTRLVTLDTATGKTAQFGYPIDASAYKKTADAKIGDLVALSETEFLILEQGTDKTGPRNLVYKLDLKGASDLTGKKAADGQELESLTMDDLKATGIVLATKTLVLDLRDWAWKSEKAEGLAVLDNRRFAVVSDNDFGLATTVVDPATGADGKAVTDATAYSLVDGVLQLDGKPTQATLKADDNKQPTTFWIFTTLKPFY